MGKSVFAAGARLILPVFLCTLNSNPTWAEGEILTLTQAVKISLQNNGDLKTFREEKNIRDAGRIRAGVLSNPTFDLEAGTGVLTGSSDENSLSLGLSQEFFLGGKREKRLAVAERELDIYSWQLMDRERLLREEVKQAYLDVTLAAERITLSERSIDLNHQLLVVAKERLAAGDIPELEMNLVKVELARSEGARIGVERSLNQTRSILWSLMGAPPGESPSITGSFETGFDIQMNLPDLKQSARRNRPDLKALEAEKIRGEAGIILADAETIPDLTAGLALKRDTTAMEIAGNKGKDTAYTVAVKLSIPIPLFDRNQANIQEARARKSITESRLTAATRNIEREVETTYFGVLNADKVLSLYRSNIIPQLEENLKLTQEAYRLGEVGVLAVIQEQKKFFEVSDGYLTAKHDRQTALVRLESAVATDITGGAK